MCDGEMAAVLFPFQRLLEKPRPGRSLILPLASIDWSWLGTKCRALRGLNGLADTRSKFI